jgi:hypothetical protein
VDADAERELVSIVSHTVGYGRRGDGEGAMKRKELICN